MENWVPRVCNEKSGFLFRHRCDREVHNQCSRCGKPICLDHTHESEQGNVCTTCMKTLRKVGERQDDDDPYFYGAHYYAGHGRRDDPHDFTEADAESLSDADEERFESDVTES